MRRTVILVVLAGVLVHLPHPATARASTRQSFPPVAWFIEIVRGYDAATIRRTFPAYNTGIFERVFGAGAGIALADDAQRALFADQRVLTPRGVVVDIGHVVTGLEAAGPLPPSAQLVARISGCDMRAAVTWSGDIGQALATYVLAGSVGSPATFLDAEAPEEDLYGDIDGYVLGADANGSPVDVAAVLTDAYLASDYEAHRFTRFIEALGPDWAEVVRLEVACYARAFAMLPDPAPINAAAPLFAARLIAFVSSGAQEALTPGPSPAAAGEGGPLWGLVPN